MRAIANKVNGNGVVLRTRRERRTRRSDTGLLARHADVGRSVSILRIPMTSYATICADLVTPRHQPQNPTTRVMNSKVSSSILTLAYQLARMGGGINGAQKVIALKVGHMSNTEYPVAFNAAPLDFLAARWATNSAAATRASYTGWSQPVLTCLASCRRR